MADEPETTPAAKPSRMAKLKRVGILVLTALVFAGGGYGAGWLQGYLATREAEEARDAAEARLSLLEARRALSQAEEAIGEADFGAARGHVDEARQELEASPSAATPEISAIIGHLRAVQIGAGDAQREASTIRRLARRLDGLHEGP